MTLAPPIADARALVAAQPAFDAHVDALQRALDLGHDLGEVTPGHFDLVRAHEGGLGAVVLVSWVDAPYATGGARSRAAALMAEGHALAARHPARIALVSNAVELAEAQRAGRIAGVLGIEGGHAIEADLGALETFFEDGLRVMTLVWNNHLPWIRSCQDDAGAGVPEGLSSFGRDVVRRMNELGIVVDVSHAGERSFYDVLDVARAPVIASHSGCAALHDHPRNLDDAQLRALAAADGVIGIVFHPGFLDAGARAEEQRVRETDCYRAARGENETALFLKQQALMRAKAAPLPLARLVEHVVHALEVAGPRHVGLGSDYDGILRAPVGVEDARGYVRIAEALLIRGIDEATVRGVMGANMERVFARVTGTGTAAASSTVAPISQHSP